MTVTVVTPWHQHQDLYDDFMAAVEAGPTPTELLIVDNASVPPLQFAAIRLRVNAGFCGGCNAGLEAAVSDVVVFLNNDIAPAGVGWLDTLTAAVEPGVLVGQIRDHHYTLVDGVRLPYLDGWCLAGMRQDFLDLGGFDETLAEPAYFSDNILCLEARAAGMTLRGVTVPLLHKGGATAGNSPDVKAAFTVNHNRYMARAREVLTPA